MLRIKKIFGKKIPSRSIFISQIIPSDSSLLLSLKPIEEVQNTSAKWAAEYHTCC